MTLVIYCGSFCIGAYIGNAVSIPLSGLLCQYGFSGGWPSAFYVFGETTCSAEYAL